VVNFVLAGDQTDDLTRAVQVTAAAVAARDGEPNRAAYTRSGCTGLLERAGFSSITPFDAAALNSGTFLTAAICGSRIRPLSASPEPDRRRWGTGV
jgi:hypothetical protein